MSTGWGTSSGFGGQLAISGTAQQPATAGFGASSNNAFGQKPLLSANTTQNTSGGLFGNSASGGGMFGQNPQNLALGGLFGSSNANLTSNSTANQPSNGGLFGNSNTTANSANTGLFGSSSNKPATGLTGGLFGNSSAGGNNATGNSTTGTFGTANSNPAAPSGGLFGNSTNTTGGGLFTNSGAANTTSNASGGLFGAKPATGGLFGSTSAPPATGGLFGGSSTNTAPQANSGGLFSKPPSSTGGLFGNSSTLNKPAGGLFGASSSNSGGLFGNSSSSTQQTNGLFGQANTGLGGGAIAATTTNNSNPYLSSLILSTINRTDAAMPLSITGTLFSRNAPSSSKDSEAPKSKEKSSLLSKLAQTFNIFRTTVDSESTDSSFSRLKGIFTQLNFIKNDQVINKAKYSVTKPRNTSSAFVLLLENRGADVKRLVIKSKPLKFHLINADKVFNAKRKRVLALALQTTSQFNNLTDDDESDNEQALLTERKERQVAEEVPIKVAPAETKISEESEHEENIEGYWCSPSIKELRKLRSVDLANVDNFIVGKYNVGQIAYNYPVDLSALFSRCDEEGLSVAEELFGKIIKMRECVVQVYDIDEGSNFSKPPIGFELNVPATITIKTPPKKKISKQDHIKRLQNMTGMEFVTFDPLTDNWTFKVKHFSVWGLIDDSEDEEEDAEMKRLRELKRNKTRKKTRLPCGRRSYFDNFNRQSTLATSKDWLLQLELANDIDSALTPYLAIPRNQKLSLKAVNDILFSDFDRSSVDSDQISTPIKEVPLGAKLIAAPPSFEPTTVSRLIQSLLLKADIQVRSNKFPRLQLNQSLSFKDIISFIGESDSDSEALALASILFDKIDISTIKKYSKVVTSHAANSSLIQRLELLEQRKQLEQWLKKNNLDDMESDGDSLALIENFIIHGEIKPAIQLALSSRNTHLAVLLNLVDSNDATVKTLAKSQLDDWRINNAIEFVPSQLVSIYQILAGQFDIANGSFITIVGLHIFYGNPAESLESVFKSIDGEGNDNFADILKIYTTLKLEGLSASIGCIKNSHLSEKVKWELLSVLNASYGQNILLAIGDDVKESFGSLLATNGLWKEAIFVFSTLSDDDKVRTLIRKTVIANIEHIKGQTNDEEEYVVKVLGVPRSLVYEAVAIERANRKDYWKQGVALVEAELWSDAHECVCKHLGPAAVIDNDYELKKELRTVIASFPQHGSIIPKWKQGAGLYSGYFDVLDSFSQQACINSEDLSTLLNNLALMSDYDSFDVKVAIKLMSKKIADIALETKEKLPDLRKKISALQLGDNERRYLDSRLVAVGL
ncbi:CIC11C00000002696 [Sungouiella intermedia]|uniref:CIC11C00000002696 n=1 Tax=Sungouiella intermedia TaxID=45354 RepID=A0A1L0GPT0_9ASCO|nr:CIC11C00000002696 [[Candida] intermedia]